MADLEYQREDHPIVNIVVLTLIYDFLAIFVSDFFLNPFNPSTRIQHVELIVVITAAVVFGSLVGGAVGSLGYLTTQLLLVIDGSGQPVGVNTLLILVPLFIGPYLLGKLTFFKLKYKESLLATLISAKTWGRMILNTVSSILTLAILSNLLKEFLLSLVTSGTFTSVLPLFIDEFIQDVISITLLAPLTLIIYEIVDTIRYKRQVKLDRDYRKLEIETVEQGAAVLEDVYFDNHAFRIGSWTPITIKFRHDWNANRSYNIEGIATARIYPHHDSTPVLSAGEVWSHTFYVLPVNQEFIDLKIRISPSQSTKYREHPKSQTDIKIHGQTYSSRDLLLVGLIILSEVIISLFLLSLLWQSFGELILNQFFYNSVTSGNTIQDIQVPWRALLILVLIEGLLFFPFLIIMFYLQRTKQQRHKHHELSFSQQMVDLPVDDEIGNVSSTKFYWIFSILLLLVGLASVVILFLVSINRVPGLLVLPKNRSFLIAGLCLFSLICWGLGLNLISQISKFGQEVKWEKGKFIQEVIPLDQFKKTKPTEILLSIMNTTEFPGVRVIFESNDAISPPMVELHLAPGHKGEFKVALTPQSEGEHEILAVLQPLFSHDLEYIPLKESRSITHQNISYNVIGDTIVGITQGQFYMLKTILGWGSLIASTLSFATRFVEFEIFLSQWRDSVPWLVTLQVPFIYLYFIFSNRYLATIQTY